MEGGRQKVSALEEEIGVKALGDQGARSQPGLRRGQSGGRGGHTGDIQGVDTAGLRATGGTEPGGRGSGRLRSRVLRPKVQYTEEPGGGQHVRTCSVWFMSHGRQFHAHLHPLWSEADSTREQLAWTLLRARTFCLSHAVW